MQNVEQPRTGSVKGHEINPIEISMAPTYRENVQGALSEYLHKSIVV